MVRRKLNVTGRALGIDLAGSRLPSSTGETVYLERDVLALANKKQCQFATLINVLPGLPSFAVALGVLRKACIISRDFVYVVQPNFDANASLLRLGLKTYHADSSGSRFQGTTADYYRMVRTLLDQGLIADFSIVESGRIRDSADEVVHPLETPPDSGPYDEARHRFKPTDIVFVDPIYRRLQLILTRKPAQLAPISRRLREFDDHENVVVSSAFVEG